MNFFVKPYLYTDRDTKQDYLKFKIKKFLYNAEFKNLPIGMQEYLNLPLPIGRIVDETLEEISDIKSKQLKKLNSSKQGRARNGFR